MCSAQTLIRGLITIEKQEGWLLGGEVVASGIVRVLSLRSRMVLGSLEGWRLEVWPLLSGLGGLEGLEEGPGTVGLSLPTQHLERVRKRVPSSLFSPIEQLL